MALGALIGAYQEDDSVGLRALLPLAGRTLLEYQVRCAAAAGATPATSMTVPDASSAAAATCHSGVCGSDCMGCAPVK